MKVRRNSQEKHTKEEVETKLYLRKQVVGERCSLGESEEVMLRHKMYEYGNHSKLILHPPSDKIKEQSRDKEEKKNISINRHCI